MPGPSSLDPLETSVAPSPASPSGPPDPLPANPIPFRHSGWQPTRARIRAALHAVSPSDTRIIAFDACGSGAFLVRNPADPDEVAISACYCHDRFCRPCSTARSHRIAARLAEIAAPKNCRFVTLTLAQDHRPLLPRLTHLYDSFRRLRNTAAWKRRVKGAAWFLEIGYSPEQRTWHPHIHLITTGSYYPQAELSRAWLTATGDSRIVDIRKVHRTTEIARYVSKYVTKPLPHVITHDHEALCEAIAALHARRLCGTLGDWRGLRLNDPPEPLAWDRVVPLVTLLDRARNGDTTLQCLLTRLRHHSRTRLTPDEQQALGRSPPSGDSSTDYPAFPTARSATELLHPDWLRPPVGW